MYDSVLCHQKLPDLIIEGKIVNLPEDTVWQTKDFECLLDIYHIDIHNRLLRKESKWGVDHQGHIDAYYEGPFEIIPFHGIFEFYTLYQKKYLVTFYAKYTDGLLVSISPNIKIC